MSVTRLVLLVLVVTAPAYGRRAVPLMPPRLAATSDYAPGAWTQSSRASAPEGKTRTSVVGWGVELGVVGKGHETGADVLGLQMLWGGRVFARLPVFRSFFLKPSLGYFRRAERSGSSGVTQQNYEAGLTAYYALVRLSRFRWMVGVSQRLELLRSTLVTPGTSGDSPLAWRYRAGPSTGVAYGLSPGLSLALDAEVTIGETRPVRTFAGMTAGVIFFLD